MEETKKEEIKIEIDDNTAQGAYVNLAMVGHSENEFVIDFIFMQPGAPKGKVRSRIITSPAHLKKLIKALGENLAKYESRFGEIKQSAVLNNDKKIGFYH